MEKIIIRGLKIFSYHGVNEEEKKEGQYFILDLCLWADLSCAGQSDRLGDTVNYAHVRKTVDRAFTGERYNLIERAATVVCEEVLKGHPRVEKIRLTLKKPNAPMNADFEYVAVEKTMRRVPR